MKKIILIATVVLFAIASMAQAQTTTPTKPAVDPAKAEAGKTVRTDVKTLKQDEKAFKEARKSKDAAAITAAKQKIKTDRVALKTDVQHAKAVGIKKPLNHMAKQMARRKQMAKTRTK